MSGGRSSQHQGRATGSGRDAPTRWFSGMSEYGSLWLITYVRWMLSGLPGATHEPQTPHQWRLGVRDCLRVDVALDVLPAVPRRCPHTAGACWSRSCPPCDDQRGWCSGGLGRPSRGTMRQRLTGCRYSRGHWRQLRGHHPKRSACEKRQGEGAKRSARHDHDLRCEPVDELDADGPAIALACGGHR